MAISGAQCRIYSTGAAAAFTGEACTLSGGNTIATITNTAKRIVDPDTAFTLLDNGVAQAANTYTLNHLYGVATKATGSWTGPVTMDGASLPRLELDETVSAELRLDREPIDATVMSANAHRQRIMGLMSAALTLTVLAAPQKDYDSGGGTLLLEAVLNTAARKVLEVAWPGAVATFRMFAFASSNSNPTSVEGRREGTFEFISTAVSAVNKPFAWSDE